MPVNRALYASVPIPREIPFQCRLFPENTVLRG